MWGLAGLRGMFAGRGVIPSQRPGDFCWFLFLLEFLFTLITNQQHNCYSILKLIIYPTPPKSTNSLHVGTITKRRKETNRDKTKIRVGNYVTVKVR